MGLESAQYINGLVTSNPAGADDRSTSDDHHRLIKTVLKTTWPNIDGEVRATPTVLNYLTGVASDVQTQLDSASTKIASVDARVTSASLYLTGKLNDISASLSDVSAVAATGLASVAARADSINAQLVSVSGALTTKDNALSAGIAAVSARADGISAGMTSIDARATSLNSMAVSASARISSVDARVYSASLAFTERFTSVNAKDASQSLQLTSVNNRATSLAAAAVSLDSRCTSLNARITSNSAVHPYDHAFTLVWSGVTTYIALNSWGHGVYATDCEYSFANVWVLAPGVGVMSTTLAMQGIFNYGGADNFKTYVTGKLAVCGQYYSFKTLAFRKINEVWKMKNV